MACYKERSVLALPGREVAAAWGAGEEQPRPEPAYQTNQGCEPTLHKLPGIPPSPAGSSVVPAWGVAVGEGWRRSPTDQVLGMDELARHVFSYLGTGDCMAVGASCQRFKRIIRGEVVRSLTIGRRLMSCSWRSVLRAVLGLVLSPRRGPDCIPEMLQDLPKLKALRIAGGVSVVGGQVVGLGALVPLQCAIMARACEGLERLSLFTHRRDAITGLCRALASGGCPGLKELDLGGAALTSAAGQQLKKALVTQQLPSLERLVIHGWPEWKQDGSLGLASGLFDGGARCLTELDLCFGIHDMPSLCAALYAKACPQLRVLRLAFTSIDVSGALLLALVLRHRALPDLRHLDLSYNFFAGEGADDSAAVPQLTASLSCTPHLTQLDLAGLGLGDAGALHLSTASLPSLTALDLALNGITSAGATSLASAMARPMATPQQSSLLLPRLEKLNLAHNNIGPAGARAIYRACQAGALSRLSCLVLCCNGLGDDAAASIADILRARAGSLTELNLASNGLTVAGLWLIIQSLAQGGGRSLSVLHLGMNQLGGWGAGALAGALGHACPHLRALDVTFAGIEGWGAVELVRVLGRRAAAAGAHHGGPGISLCLAWNKMTWRERARLLAEHRRKYPALRLSLSAMDRWVLRWMGLRPPPTATSLTLGWGMEPGRWASSLAFV